MYRSAYASHACDFMLAGMPADGWTHFTTIYQKFAEGKLSFQVGTKVPKTGWGDISQTAFKALQGDVTSVRFT